MKILFIILAILTYPLSSLINVKNVFSDVKHHLNDTMQTELPSGFYLVRQPTTIDLSRKLKSFQREKYLGGKAYTVLDTCFLNFEKIDSVYVKYLHKVPSSRIKLNDIYIVFTEEGKKEFFTLTKTKIELSNQFGNEVQFLIGTIINDNLIHVVDVSEPIENNPVTLSGAFTKKEADEIRLIFEKEIQKGKQRKNDVRF